MGSSSAKKILKQDYREPPHVKRPLKTHHWHLDVRY